MGNIISTSVPEERIIGVHNNFEDPEFFTSENAEGTPTIAANTKESGDAVEEHRKMLQEPRPECNGAEPKPGGQDQV